MAIGPRKKRAITNLCTLFDAELCPIEETNQLITVAHDKLVEAFTYWIDQSKTFFGKPAIVRNFHSFKEEGIDITIDLLMQPQVRFGIQIKSYKDIQKKSLAGQVHEQISRSHKHNLSKLMLALAGDMNDISQNPKVSGIVSEIHQNKGDNDYVIVIPPQLRKKFMDTKNETVELEVESLEGSAENKLLWFPKCRNQHSVK